MSGLAGHGLHSAPLRGRLRGRYVLLSLSVKCAMNTVSCEAALLGTQKIDVVRGARVESTSKTVRRPAKPVLRSSTSTRPSTLMQFSRHTRVECQRHRIYFEVRLSSSFAGSCGHGVAR